MCSHYEAPSSHQVAEAFGVALFDQGRLDLWPGYIGLFLRRPDRRAEDNDSSATMKVGVRGAMEQRTDLRIVAIGLLSP
ncbi:hypothetical protein ALO37_200124 [Pseudomonas savastanoi pv. glycinea]|nr:hypothetical protein ALO37_200124 [Pseudomonas savastanoi pv. glycinea]RMU43587.1 hypothetical protein ALP27_200184 [Pseudomonas savastanoi pv. glycinea]